MADVNVSIGATLGELRKGVDDAGKLVDGFRKKSAEAKGAAVTLAQGIEAIGGASNSAAKMAGNLLAGFAIGGPMGLAVAGVNALIGVIQQAKKEEEELKKKAEETAKIMRERAARVASTGDSIRERAHAAETELQLALATSDAQREQIRAQEKLRDIERERQKVKKDVELSAAQRATVLKWLNDEAEAVKGLNAHLLEEAILKDRAAGIGAPTGPIAPGELPSGFNAPVRGTQAERPAGFDPLAGVVAGGGAFSDEGQAKQHEQFMRDAIKGAREYTATVEDAKQAQREMAESARQVGVDVGMIFSGIATGSTTAGEAFASMGQYMLSILLDVASKTIMAHALEAGSGAAASQASIPFVGPALAVAAMTAMIGTVQGLLGSLPSAAGGLMVPEDMLLKVHEDERVLPARYSRGLDRMVESAASGRSTGGRLNVTIAGAMDGASVYRTLTRRDRDVARALDRMARRRR